MKKTVSLIIVHWNTPDLLETLLASIGTSEGIELIVVDNHSENFLSETQLKKYSNVTFLINQENKGFSSACNQGALKAIGKWLLFLNPDVTITASEVLKMVEYAESHRLDALSPNPKSEGYAKPIPSPMSLLQEFTPLGKLLPASKATRKTLTGGCLLIKKTILDQIGGWDEQFFLWFEDSDLTKRLYDANDAVGWYPKPIAHQGAGSINQLSKDKQKQLFFTSMRRRHSV
jgi:GT2 family glycosyltransferase